MREINYFHILYCYLRLMKVAKKKKKKAAEKDKTT